MNFNQTNNNQGDVINNGPDSVIEEWQKGAILARAAPELYAALELLLSAQGHMEEKAIKLAQAALAKARGEKTNE